MMVQNSFAGCQKARSGKRWRRRRVLSGQHTSEELDSGDGSTPLTQGFAQGLQSLAGSEEKYESAQLQLKVSKTARQPFFSLANRAKFQSTRVSPCESKLVTLSPSSTYPRPIKEEKKIKEKKKGLASATALRSVRCEVAAFERKLWHQAVHMKFSIAVELQIVH